MAKSCCCCFSVKTGAFLIGVLMMFDLLNEFEYFNMLRCLIKLIVVGTFLWMLLHDNKDSRKWFFIAFVANPFLQVLASTIDKP